MSRVFFAQALEPVATFWRIHRKDGVALGFTSHDRDLWFDGLLHRAAPGMVPSAIRRSADLSPDSADVEGALSHDAITPADLAAGRFEEAHVAIGVVDWETHDQAVLYRGTIGAIAQEGGRFSAELRSAKHALAADTVPRTGPTCRAAFCGPGCTLSASRFTHEVMADAIDLAANRVSYAAGPPPDDMRGGFLRWLDGPQAGIAMRVIDAGAEGLALDIPLDAAIQSGTRAMLREGCDRTIATCTSRFDNAINFQGEPFLPGNDLLARYGQPVG